MPGPLDHLTPGKNDGLGEVPPAQAEQIFYGEGLRSQSLDPEGSHSIATDEAVLLKTETSQEDDAATLQTPGDLSRENLEEFRDIRKTSGVYSTRAPSPNNSDVDRNIEKRPLKSDYSGDKHASIDMQKAWYYKKPLPKQAKIWALRQLGIPYIIATVVMGIHLGFFCYLHDKPVNKTISQSLQSAIANLFAFVIGTALMSVIAVAYDQIIWRLFSSKFLKAKIIDQLVTLTSNPWNILRLELLREAPWQWTLVWCCIFVPIACNFPPGALTVINGQYQVDQRVPTVNVSITGNGTFTDLSRYALFDTTVGLNYFGPREDLKRIAFTVLTTGEAYTLPGPCSSLCRYSLEFQGPFWDCEDVLDPTPWPKRDVYDEEQSQYIPTIFSASSDQHRATDQNNNPLITPDLLAETLMFQWYPTLNISNKSDWSSSPNSTQQRANIKPPKQLNCTTKVVNYKTHISYDERGRRTIRWGIENKESAFNAMPVRMNYNDILVERAPGSSPRDINVEFSAETRQNYSTTQLHTIHDAALEPLLGYLYGYYSYFNGTTYNFVVRGNGTLIGSGRFVHVASDDPILKVDITATALEEYLFNVTLSTIALNNMNEPLWLTPDPVTVWDRTSTYSFDQKIQFYVPYAISLAATTFVAIAGIWCLVINGTSAGNSFLQYVSTTRISNSLQQMGLGSSRGGDENFTQEFRDTKLLFGVQQHLNDSGSGHEQSERLTAVVYGFGEEHEVQPFI